MTEGVLIATISMVGGLGVAWITNVAAKKVQSRKKERQPKDRMERMFDGYDRLINQMASEDERKARIIREQQKEIADMRSRLKDMEATLAQAQDDLIESHSHKQLLTQELDKLRQEYIRTK